MVDGWLSHHRRRRVDLLLATLVGLSWFALARVSFELSRMAVLAGWWHGVPWWHVLSTVRLVLGLAIYVPVAAVVAWRTAPSARSRLVAIGLLPQTRMAAACGGVLLILGMLIAGPGFVYSKIAEHFGSSVMSLLAGLQPPVVEEFLVRGIVWAILAQSFPAAFVLVWSSLLHWTFHLEFGFGASIITGVYGGVVLGGSRLVSGAIWVGLLFHLAGNAGAGQALFPAVLTVGAGCALANVVRTRRGRTRG